MCQQPTYAPATTIVLFNDLVGAREQRRWHVESERPRGFQVDHHLELGRLHDWQIGRLLALEDSARVYSDLAIAISKAHTVTDQAAARDELALRVDRDDPITCC